MHLTKHTDYALRVLIFLAQRGELSTIRDIAELHDISHNHLMKIVVKLAKLGYVESVRGNGGGIRLAREPGSIVLGEVVRGTEETLKVVECLDPEYDGACRLLAGCALKGILRGANRAFLEHLDRYTLQDLIPRAGRAVVRFSKRAGGTLTQ
jgi:Rrf2 family transcriptional regulator, nitric oxide-sensitive transcriptional repressor